MFDEAINTIEKEIEATRRLIKHYLDKGDPSIEVFTPSPFAKLEELENAKAILINYNRQEIGCNLGTLTI